MRLSAWVEQHVILPVLLISLALSLGFAADRYLHRPPPRSVLTDAVGIHVEGGFREHCGWFRWRTRIGDAYTGRAACGWPRSDTTSRMNELEEFAYWPWTGRTTIAQHAWLARDATLWRHEIDSIRAAFRTRGGMPCAAPSPDTTRHAGVVAETWRFPEFDLRLSGGSSHSFPPGADTTRRWGWWFNLRATRERRKDCH